jgi:hypothetical protein
MNNNYRIIKLFTENETLEISKVINGVAYDQFNRKIPKEYLKFQLDVLQEEWINPNIEVKELAN